MGYSVKFDENGYIKINSLIRESDIYMVSLYATFTSGDWKGALMGFGGNNNLYYQASSDSFGFNSWNGDVFGVEDASKILHDGAFHHILAEFHSNDIKSNKLWIDGILQDIHQVSGVSNNNALSNELRIAYGGYTDSQRHRGYIDELSVWEGVLDENTKNRLCSKKSFDVKDNRLLTYFKFNEGEGTKIYSSNNTIEGEFYGAPQWSASNVELTNSKFLILYNNQYYTFNDSNIILSPSQELNQDNFITNGFNNITNITEEQWDNAFPNKTGLKLLMWTEDLDKTKIKAECEVEPFTPYDKLNDEFEICMATEKNEGIS